MNPIQIFQTIQSFQEKLHENLCQLVKINKYNALEFGEINQAFVPRSADKLQYVKEGKTTTELNVDVRGGSGYYPRDGYVANLGDDPFQVILVGTRGQSTTAFTITPNTSYAINSPIESVKIIPVNSLTAFYQVSVV
jgi:hypothetical protein